MWYQELESCPTANISNFRELLKEENFYLITEVSTLINLDDIVQFINKNNLNLGSSKIFVAGLFYK